jgi:hypothetical protein
MLITFLGLSALARSASLTTHFRDFGYIRFPKRSEVRANWINRNGGICYVLIRVRAVRDNARGIKWKQKYTASS